LIVIGRLRKLLSGSDVRPRVRLLAGATAPENLTGQIKKYRPTHLVIVDAADVVRKPGTATLLEPDETAGATFCTHSLPIKVMTDYLKESFKCRIVLLGIQPRHLDVGAAPSSEVVRAADSLARLLAGLLKELLRRRREARSGGKRRRR
jgi:hydrogenase 3 maturation protease